MAEQLNAAQIAGQSPYRTFRNAARQCDDPDLNRLLHENAAKRIEETFDMGQVIGHVFNTESSLQNFTSCLRNINPNGGLLFGGRELRKRLGCEVTDFAPFVIQDAEDLDPFQCIRLGPLRGSLLVFPQKRMEKIDLDFFTDGQTPESLFEEFTRYGFKTNLNQATGGVSVIDVQGENGSATFIDKHDSWQTGARWPLFGFTAPVRPDASAVDLSISALRMICPLQIPDIGKNPIDPNLVAAIARGLLWAASATDPSGKALRLPTEQLTEYFATVEQFSRLFEDVTNNPELESQYRSGIRDMALALRVILLTDWHGYYEDHPFSAVLREKAEFFGQITAAWNCGRIQRFY